MNNEFYHWFNEQSKNLGDTDKKLFMMWSSSTWNKQQETIDEQLEMLVNQAKTIMEKNKRIEELEKTLKEFYYVSDAATIFKVKENLEKYDE